MLHVSHNVTNYEFFYEPFYVSLDSVPRYDERFVGYGFTRNTQVKSEMIFIGAFNDHSRNITVPGVRLASLVGHHENFARFLDSLALIFKI